MQDQHITIPKDAGRALLQHGGVSSFSLLSRDNFIKFCCNRALIINRERLINFERLGVFTPLFRLYYPKDDEPLLKVPVHDNQASLDKHIAWDIGRNIRGIRSIESLDRASQPYYSAFQIDYLGIVISSLTLSIHLDSYIQTNGSFSFQSKYTKHWGDYTKLRHSSLLSHEFRIALALLCQYISDRYGPHAKSDKRTVIAPGCGSYVDQCMYTEYFPWDRQDLIRNWDPHHVESMFNLTPKKLVHAYETLSIDQSSCDPLDEWYQLLQFIKVSQRERLKGDALRAETLRAGATMLGCLYKDLYNEELDHPNEIGHMVRNHIPELCVRKDVRRYLEYVTNRFGLNPRPKLSLFVEGKTEKVAIELIFLEYFGVHPGVFGVEVIDMCGVDNITGGKDDRYRAILRLVDYLHHNQTITFIILDNENYASKLKKYIKNAKSIHHSKRNATRLDYIRVWRQSFEFDNFSATEITEAINKIAQGHALFHRSQILTCKNSDTPGGALSRLYKETTSHSLNKIELTQALINIILSPSAKRKIDSRPIIKTLIRVIKLSKMNHFPSLERTWEINQSSKYFGTKRKTKDA